MQSQYKSGGQPTWPSGPLFMVRTIKPWIWVTFSHSKAHKTQDNKHLTDSKTADSLLSISVFKC